MDYEVIVVGEKCKDVFIIGEVNRLSPEAPVAILNPKDKIVNDGMAANVKQNIKSLAPELNVLSIHQKGEIIKTRFKEKTSGYILIRVDENDNVKDRIHIKRFKGFIKQYQKTLKAVVISDYNKGFLNEEDIKEMTSICKEKNIMVFLDTKKILGLWSINVDYVKINNKEFELQQKHIDKPEKFCENLIVTLGPEGSKCINKNIIVPTIQMETRDVAGAGDTYLAAFVVKYIETNDLGESMLYANKAATYAVSRQGVVAIDKNDIP